MKASNSNWQRVATVSDVQPGHPKVVRVDGRQLVLIATDDGIRACNNRCPHEGYPLSEGSVGQHGDACVVTCNWHNWKFRLDTGANVFGGDALRTYPLEVRGDDIWLDLSDPPREEQVAASFRRLREAFDDNDYERLARECARLRMRDVSATDIVSELLPTALLRMEYGWTHAVAGIGEWLALGDEFDASEPDAALTCLLEIVGHLADDTLREPDYSFTDAITAWSEDSFVDATEAEDEATAVSLVNGALEAGLGWQDLEPAFARAALAHYYDFGHALIYVRHAGPLCELLPAAVLPILLASLARTLCNGRREDLLPEFRGYAEALCESSGGSSELPGWRAMRKASVADALKIVRDATGAPEHTHQEMLATVASQLLSFDLAQQSRSDGKVADNTSWLDLTHGITFAEAASDVCQRYPDLWPAALLQLACFSGRNRGFTTDKVALDSWAVNDAAAFFNEENQRLLDHGCDEFIASVHRLKTLRAAMRLYRGPLADARADSSAAQATELLLAGTHRYLNSPLKLKHPHRTARQARQFVSLDG